MWLHGGAMKAIFLISLCCLFTEQIFATTNSVQTSIKKEQSIEKKTSKISLSLSNSVETDLKKTDSENKAYTLSQSVSASNSLKFGKLSATLPWSYTTVNNREESDLGNASVSLSLKSYVINPVLTAYLPTSQFSKEETSYNGGFKVSGSKSLATNLFGAGISSTASLSFKKNLYKFKIDRYGGSNSSWQSAIALSLGYQLTNKISVSHSLSYSSSLNFNERLSNSLSNSHSLNYAVSRKISTNLGLSNGDSFINKRGDISAPSVFDKNTSSIFAGLSITN